MHIKTHTQMWSVGDVVGGYSEITCLPELTLVVDQLLTEQVQDAYAELRKSPQMSSKRPQIRS